MFGSVTAKQAFSLPAAIGGSMRAFCSSVAVDHDRVEAKNIHVHGGGAGEAGARRGDRLHHDGGFGDAETGTAIGLRDADAEPAAGGDGAAEFFGKRPVAITLEPIIVAKARADFLHRLAQRQLKLGQGEVDGGHSIGFKRLFTTFAYRSLRIERRSRRRQMIAPSQHSELSVPRLLRRAQRAQGGDDLDKAERLYNAALQRVPQNFNALHGLGQIHHRRGCLDTALVLFQEALKADPWRADGFASLGLLFHALKQFERALKSYDEGLRLAPGDTELCNRRGVALLELGRLNEALENFDRALAADAENPDALGNRGNALFRLNRPTEAIAAYDRALVRAPESAPLLTNRAIALRRLDRPHEALMSATRALAANPDFAPARFVEGTLRLLLGDFAAGWQGYEARWGGSMAAQRRELAAPLWLGRHSLDGKTILLHAEQGFGDTIQFVRYAPHVAERGARVVLEVQPQLVRLLSGMSGVDIVLSRKAPLPPFDFHCPLASLPLAFGTELASIPAEVPYLKVPADALARWQTRFPKGRPLVGLVWSGERAHDNDLNRSIRLATLLPLLDGTDVQFVSLQHDVREHDAALLKARTDVLHIGRNFADFADTAAAIAALDAVIAVDTAVAHLCGAMGKPLWLLLPYAADFRWLRERTDSPWYPTARLYRQEKFADWGVPVQALVRDLSSTMIPASLLPAKRSNPAA